MKQVYPTEKPAKFTKVVHHGSIYAIPESKVSELAQNMQYRSDEYIFNFLNDNSISVEPYIEVNFNKEDLWFLKYPKRIYKNKPYIVVKWLKDELFKRCNVSLMNGKKAKAHYTKDCIFDFDSYFACKYQLQEMCYLPDNTDKHFYYRGQETVQEILSGTDYRVIKRVG